MSRSSRKLVGQRAGSGKRGRRSQGSARQDTSPQEDGGGGAGEMDWTHAMRASQTLASRLQGLGLSMMAQFVNRSPALYPLVLDSSSPPQREAGWELLWRLGSAWMCPARKVTRYRSPFHSAIKSSTRPGSVVCVFAPQSFPRLSSEPVCQSSISLEFMHRRPTITIHDSPSPKP